MSGWDLNAPAPSCQAVAVLSKRWAGDARWVRGAATCLVLLLGWGCLQHLLDLALGGWDAYAYAPSWLAAYWMSLALLDPLAAVLVAHRRRSGLLLAPAILLSDAAANGYAIHVLGHGGARASTGQAIVTALAIATTLLTLRLMHSTRN